MKLADLFAGGKFVITSEVAPPKGTDFSKALDEARPLKGVVDAINVTDNQRAVLKMSSLAACYRLKQEGYEPVYQITCRDRNRLAIQSDLLGASMLGLENVLCLTGDYVSLGDHPTARAVYDMDSVQLLKTARGLNEGRDLAGNNLQGNTDFCLGAVVSPCTEPVELQLIKLEKKIEAGAQFIQTQAVYDVAIMEDFMNQLVKLNIKTPVMAGIVLLKSPKMAVFMNKNVPGISIPEPLIKELSDTPKDSLKKKCVEKTVDLINEYKELCRGIHLMPLGWTDLVPEIVKQAGLQE